MFNIYLCASIASIPAADEAIDTGGAKPGGKPYGFADDPGGGPNGPAALNAAAIWSAGDLSLGSKPMDGGLIP